MLVDRLATRWGTVSGPPFGVWFELALSAAPPPSDDRPGRCDGTPDGSPTVARSEPLQTQMHCAHGRALVSFRGALDGSTVPEARKELTGLQPDCQELAIDLRAVSYLDSSGLALLVWAASHARAEGQRLVVVRGPAQVSRVLRVSGVDAILSIVGAPPEWASHQGT